MVRLPFKQFKANMGANRVHVLRQKSPERKKAAHKKAWMAEEQRKSARATDTKKSGHWPAAGAVKKRAQIGADVCSKDGDQK